MNADWLQWRGRPVIYRCYDEETLLYVGMSTNIELRLATHEARSFWWTSSIRTVIRLFPDRTAARAAELAAIREERPSYNIHSRRESWVAREIRDLITAIERGRSPMTAANQSRIKRLRQRLVILGDEA